MESVETNNSDMKNINDMLTKILAKVSKNEEEFDGVKKQVGENKKDIEQSNDEISELNREINRLKSIARSKNIRFRRHGRN